MNDEVSKLVAVKSFKYVTFHGKTYSNDLLLNGLKCWLSVSHLLESFGKSVSSVSQSIRR